jgi:ADP-L-glycero-D-manno-heptose 6-epimerase|tara:strand:+ start:2051 stop:2875 length:825 start_codon:yes stop_codon:yes gene_type:complete
MKILITGSNGFIGKNLVKHLMGEGHGVAEYEWIENVVPDCSQFDKVIHLGAISSTTETDVEKVMKQNLDFSERLLHVCDMQGIDLIYASSASVYGPTTHFTEDGPLQPQSPYAWSKYLFDRTVQKLDWSEYQCKIQGLRFFNVYGEHEDHKGFQMSVFHKFKEQALTGTIHPFAGSDTICRDFIYVGDICKIISKFIDTDESGIWNVGTGKATSFGSIAKCIADKHNATIEEIPIPDSVKNQYQSFTQSNNDKLLNTIGDFKFTTPFEWIEENQ